MKDPDWKGKLQKRFRWLKLRFEWGRWCYIIEPIANDRDTIWWEKED